MILFHNANLIFVNLFRGFVFGSEDHK